MDMLAFQAAAFALALYFTMNLVLTTFMFAAWINGQKTNKFEFNCTLVCLLASFCWGAFFFLSYYQ